MLHFVKSLPWLVNRYLLLNIVIAILCAKISSVKRASRSLINNFGRKSKSGNSNKNLFVEWKGCVVEGAGESDLDDLRELKPAWRY